MTPVILKNGVEWQAQSLSVESARGTFWWWWWEGGTSAVSLLYTKCQPQGAFPPLAIPQSSLGTLTEWRGPSLALSSRWCLKESPPGRPP